MRTPKKCSEAVKQKRLRAAITRLAVACPVGQNNPTACPLFLVREKKLAARVRWIDSLQNEDVVFLSSYHKVCQKWQKAGCP